VPPFPKLPPQYDPATSAASKPLKKNRKEFAARLDRAEQRQQSWLEKLEIVRNGRSAGGSWPAKISAAALKISPNFFERTPPVGE